MATNPEIENLSHEELVRLVFKLQTQYHQAKARLQGLEEHNKVLNDERRPIALENQRLKRELHDANVHIANLKAKLEPK